MQTILFCELIFYAKHINKSVAQNANNMSFSVGSHPNSYSHPSNASKHYLGLILIDCNNNQIYCAMPSMPSHLSSVQCLSQCFGVYFVSLLSVQSSVIAVMTDFYLSIRLSRERPFTTDVVIWIPDENLEAQSLA